MPPPTTVVVVSRAVLIWAIGLCVACGAAPKPADLRAAAQTGHHGPLNCVATSPDGRLVLSGGLDASVILWDLATGRSLRRLGRYDSGVRHVGFTPDSKGAIVAAWNRRSFEAWDLATGELRARFDEHPADVVTVAVAPGGDRALALCTSGDAVLWDLTARRRVAVMSAPKDAEAGSAVAISPDGRLGLIGYHERALLWDLVQGQPIREVQGHEGQLAFARFAPDGRTAVTVGRRDGTILAWDVGTGAAVATLSAGEGSIYSAALSADGARLLTGRQALVQLWDLAGGRALHSLSGHRQVVSGVGLSPDGRLGVSASNDGTLRLWDLEQGRERASYDGFASPIRAVAVTADGEHFVTGGDDARIYVWSLGTGRLVRVYETRAPVVALAVASQGDYISAADKAGAIDLFSLGAGERVNRFPHGFERSGAADVLALGASPDGQRILSVAGRGDEVVVYEDPWETRLRGRLAFEGVMLAAFTLDGGVVAVGRAGIRLWSANGREAGRADAAEDGERPLSLAVSPGGAQLAIGERDGRVRVLDMDGREQWGVAPDPGRSGKAGHPVAYSPNGRILASAAGDWTVRLWDAATGVPVRALAPQPAQVTALAFARDGRHLVSGGRDGTATVWDVERGETIYSARAAADGRHLAWTPDGYFVAESPASGEGLLHFVDGTRVERLGERAAELSDPRVFAARYGGGQGATAAPAPRCPGGMVPVAGGRAWLTEDAEIVVPDFCLDRTEVSVGEYRRCTTCEPPRSEEACNWGVAGRDGHPVNCVSHRQAAQFCEARKMRLPSKEEWAWAARGGAAARSYPWGGTSPKGRACWRGAGGGDSSGNLDGTCPVGAFPGGASADGVLDLAGNVSEWVTTWFDPRSPHRMSLGGSYDARAPEAFVQGPRRHGIIYYGSGDAYAVHGFRCALTPEGGESPGAPHLCDAEDVDDCREQCERGHGASCARLGSILWADGAAAPVDLTAACDLYGRACGDVAPQGCYGAALCHLTGKGAQLDSGGARAQLERTCVGGYSEACWTLGFGVYHQGMGAPPDTGLARKFLRLACDRGHVGACQFIEEERR